MDTITDMLSTFFVAQKRRATRQHTQTPPSPLPPVIDPELEEHVKERTRDTHTDTKKLSSKHTHSEEEMSERSGKPSSMTFSETDAESSISQAQHSQKSPKDTPLLLKKYILRAIDMYKKNIMIVNNDQSECLL